MLGYLRALLRRINRRCFTVLGVIAGLQALRTGVFRLIGLIRPALGLAFGILVAFTLTVLVTLAMLAFGLLGGIGRDLRRRGLRHIMQSRRFLVVHTRYTSILHLVFVRHVSHLLVINSYISTNRKAPPLFRGRGLPILSFNSTEAHSRTC